MGVTGNGRGMEVRHWILLKRWKKLKTVQEK